MDQIEKSFKDRGIKNVKINNYRNPYPVVTLPNGFKAMISHGDRGGLSTPSMAAVRNCFSKAQAFTNQAI